MRSLERFLRDEAGAALTTEFVLWVPIILGLAVIVIDATTIYITHSEMTNVARDTARRMVTGAVMSEAEAEAYAADAMSLRNKHNYFVEANYDLNTGAEVIIRFAVNDMSILGYGSPLRIFGGIMSSRVIMRPDPLVPFGMTGGGGGKDQDKDEDKGKGQG